MAVVDINKVMLLGNLTRDPELRTTPRGTNVCQLGLAVNRTYRDSDGNNQKDTAFVDVSCFGRQAEVIAKYLTKGQSIYVEGRLKFDSWESQSGEKRSRLSVQMESFQFVNTGRQEGGNSSGNAPAARESAPAQNNSAPAASTPTDVDEDVPF